jgi:hypothetical protein
MKLLDNRVFRRLLLSFTYAVGVFLIVASGGSSGGSGSGSSDDSCRLVVSAIARAGGTDDIWVGVLSDLPSGEFNSVARLKRDGTEAFPPIPLASGFENVIRTVAVTEGGSKVYVGGDFSEGIFRLNEDGSLDNTFVVGSGFNGSVSTIVPVGEGSDDIYVGGFFTKYQDVDVGGLVRLDVNGARVVNFAGTQEIQAVAPAGMDGTYPDGSVYSGGEFYPRFYLRWANGRIDPFFILRPEPTAPVFTLAMVAGGFGDVYVGGGFEGGLYRYTEFGVGDINTYSGFNNSVRKIVHTNDPSGDIYAVGEFTTYQGSAANGLVRLNVDGSREISFTTGTGFSNSDGAVAFRQFATSVLAADASGVVDVDGDLYVGGDFTDYDGAAADGIVRLDNLGMLDPDFVAQISSETGTCVDGTFVEDD